MSTANTITRANFAANLRMSTQGRVGVPDGNVFFDTTNGLLELLDVMELATIVSPLDNVTVIANPLTKADKVTLSALFGFEIKERSVNETLRGFDRFVVDNGSYKFAGAYVMANGRKFAATDHLKVALSGTVQRAINNVTDRIYFGVRTLGNINPTSQVLYKTATAGIASGFASTGPVDEMIQVFGDPTNGDAGTTAFDNRAYLEVLVRTYGQTHSSKTLIDSGISVMDGFSTGFAVTEATHPTTGNYPIAGVAGGVWHDAAGALIAGTQIAPYTGMSLEKLAAAQTVTGFNEGAGNFTWVLHNTASGTLEQCVAFLDMLAGTDDDIDSGAITVTHGLRVGTWYSTDANARVVTTSGADTLGLFIENLPTADQQKVVMTDDTAATFTYPFNVQLDFIFGSNTTGVADAWVEAWYQNGAATADYNTATAVTVNDANATPINLNINNMANLSLPYAYDSNTQAGLLAATDKIIVINAGGTGLVERQAIVTIKRQAVIAVDMTLALATA